MQVVSSPRSERLDFNRHRELWGPAAISRSLLTKQRWDEAGIGVVMSIATAQTPYIANLAPSLSLELITPVGRTYEGV